MLRVHLSDEQIAQLEAIRRKTDDPRTERALAVLLSNEGLSPPKIAAQLQRHYNTVIDWLKRYMADGVDGLTRRYSPGRPSERDALLAPLLEECLCKRPADYGYPEQTWSTTLIQDLCRERTGRDFSDDTVERALHDAGFSYKRPRTGVPESAPTKEEKKSEVLACIEEIRELLEKEDAEILAIDEAHFSTQPYVIRGWHKRGAPFFPQDLATTGERHTVWCIQSVGGTFLLEVCR